MTPQIRLAEVWHARYGRVFLAVWRHLMRLLGLGVVAALVGCGAPAGFDGNFTGLVSETDVCSGFGQDTYSTSVTWLISTDTQAKTLEINSDNACDKIPGTISLEMASIGPVQCRVLQAGGGDTFTQRIDTGSLSLDTNRDLVMSLSGSYVYSESGSAPVNCTYSMAGTLYRFE